MIDPVYEIDTLIKPGRFMLEDEKGVLVRGGVPLMGRLKAVHLIPKILKIPLIGSHFMQSWEIKAIITKEA